MFTFQAGQNLSLSQQTPGLQSIDVRISWEPRDTPVIIDMSAFALTAQGHVRDDGDFIFYNQPALSGDGLVLHPEEQRFSVQFAALPPAIERIAMTLTLDGAATFSAIQRVRLEIHDANRAVGIAQFVLDTRQMAEAAIVLGEVYRRGADWKFRAVGQGFIGGLAALARHFGVDVSDDAPTSNAVNAVEAVLPVAHEIHSPEPVQPSSPSTASQSVIPPIPPSVPISSVNPTQLGTMCRTLEHVSTEFAQWLETYPDRVGQEKVGLTKEFRRLTAQARRLQQAVARPMCAGVFGPSQSGKSYLISALARKGTAPLMADFSGKPIDFIREINPEGGRESTGLVTRFTLKSAPGASTTTPVQMRLLTQTDLVKVIGNTYYADCDHSDDVTFAQNSVAERLTALAALAQAQPVDPLTADDVFDLQAYFERYFKGFERIRLLRNGYWEQAAQLAPRLRIAERAQLFGMIWGDVAAFNQLYVRLYAGLQGLNFATDACAGLEALLPREQSIIDVQTLKGLGDGSGHTLTLMGSNGARVTLPRSEVTALIAELRIVISEKPWDFFEDTDLLDFPGARSREQIKDLPGFLEGQDALQGLFLRGKVSYLFERYCAEQELTSMLLCIGPSNQEVKSLPEMVQDWIASTHGVTPAQRSQQPTALFLVLTKFDMEFEEKAGERSPESRWITRMESSLLNFFGKQHDWPRQWDMHGVFRNSYWLRNPNFKAKNIFDYDDENHEIAVRPGERKRIDQFKAAFLNDRVANAHFRDPQAAWEAGFALNDGGVRYLAENLRPLCNPALKWQQLAAQAARLRDQIIEQMAHYYISDDPEQELNKRLAAAQTVAGYLIDCAGDQRFGALLSALQVHAEDLEGIYHQIETRVPDEKAAISAPTIGAAVNTQQMKALLGLTPANTAQTAATRKDDAALFASEVIAAWMRDLQDIGSNPALCAHYRLPESAITDLVKELIAGAQRLKLEARIEEIAREATGFRMKFEHLVMLPSRLTANVLNQYVGFLGYDTIALDQRPVLLLETGPRPVFPPRAVPRGGPQLGEQPATYDQDYYTDWIRAFLDIVDRNARCRDGMEFDITANRSLGELLSQVRSTQ